MRHEDLGFVVSRALSVWIASISIRELYPIIASALQVHWASSNHSDKFGVSMFVGQLAVEVARVGPATLLWTKASSFASVCDNELANPELMTLGPDEFQPAVMTAVGLIILLQSLATIGEVLVDRLLVKDVHGVKPMSARIDWQGVVFEAIVGAIVHITCLYPNWFRKLIAFGNYSET